MPRKQSFRRWMAAAATAGCLCGRVYQCPSRLPVTAMMVPLMAAFSVYGLGRPLLTSILTPTNHIPQPPLFLSAPIPLTPKVCLPFPGTPRHRYSMVLCERPCDIVKIYRSPLLIPQGAKVGYPVLEVDRLRRRPQ